MTCNCPECQAERLLGKSITEFTPSDVKNMGLGCYWCAMTGYEDYPHNKKPCRDGCGDPIAAMKDAMASGRFSASSMKWNGT